MIVWVLTYNDGDYYSTYDEFLSVHASKQAAQDAARAMAEGHQSSSSFYRNREIGEWVLSSVADRYFRGNPEQVQQQMGSATWYVFPEEV